MSGVAREFWRWWLGQLADLLPGSWRRAGQGKPAGLILVPTDAAVPDGLPAVTARLEKRGRIERLGRLVLDGDGLRRLRRAAAAQGGAFETRLELASGAILEKRLTLPLAAERDLDRVLGFEMDRETPFAADEVYWASQILERDRDRGRLTVRLTMVAKAPLAELVAALSRAGLAPAALMSAGALIPIGNDASRRPSRAGPALAWLCAVLAVVAVATPFAQQSAALGDAERRIETLRPDVEAVERLRQRLEGDRQAAESVAAERARFGDPLKMLAAVTAALPDDTRLIELDYSLGKLVLTGQSRAAAPLIGDISRSPDLRDPAFSAPVTRAEPGQVDLFTITARTGP
jgi:general secretion pathway protein L